MLLCFFVKIYTLQKNTARFSPKARFINETPMRAVGGVVKKEKVMKIRSKTFIHGSNIILTTEERKKRKGKRKVTQKEIDFCLHCEKSARECKGSCRIRRIDGKSENEQS